MNTPTHIALNYLVFHRQKGVVIKWVLLGAFLPDLPMLAFYVYQRYLMDVSWHVIWRDVYYQPDWQTLFNFSHSIPLAVGLFLFFYFRKNTAGQFFCLSLILHSLVDWPTHLEDAHAYFWPLYREKLPGFISYWRESYFWLIEYGIIFLAAFVYGLRAFLKSRKK